MGVIRGPLPPLNPVSPGPCRPESLGVLYQDFKIFGKGYFPVDRRTRHDGYITHKFSPNFGIVGVDCSFVMFPFRGLFMGFQNFGEGKRLGGLGAADHNAVQVPENYPFLVDFLWSIRQG